MEGGTVEGEKNSVVKIMVLGHGGKEICLAGG
jgi:hypothetical protein